MRARVSAWMDSSSALESGVNLGEKRPAEAVEDGVVAEAPPSKRPRKNGGGGDFGSMRKVAEMVLVLAAMGKMRGGKVPTGLEKGIMAATRDKLVEVCELFPPKDVFPRDLFGGIIVDLGLNKLGEQKLGMRHPKLSIAEKFLLSKKQMENMEELTPPSATNLSQRLHGNSGAAVEYRSPVPASRVFPADGLTYLPTSSGSFQPSPLGHVAGTNSMTIPYQLPTSEVRPPVGASGLPTSHLGRDSTPVAPPRIDRMHLRLDGRPNGSPLSSHVQANSSGDRTFLKPSAWSWQPQSSKLGVEKVPTHTAAKVEGVTDTKPGIANQITPPKPLVTQTKSGAQFGIHQHFQGTNIVQASVPRNTHAEICKIVQKILQPRVSDRPVWTPPSRDYMNKAVTCQTCQSIVDEVDNVVICDACDKGYHLKCLQINNPRGVPRGEWHCDRCLQLSNGKPLPPKYGRVLRNTTVPKGPANTAALQSTPDKKTGASGEKVNPQKVMANGNSAMLSTPAGNTVMNYSHQSSVSKVENSTDNSGNAVVGRAKMDEKSSLSIPLNNLMRTSNAATASTGVSVARSYGEKFLESKSHPLKSETALHFSGPSQSPAIQEDNWRSALPNSVVSVQQSSDNHLRDKHLKDSCSVEILGHNLTENSSQDDSGIVRSVPAETSTTTSVHAEHERSLTEHVNSVDWVGGVHQVDKKNAFYLSCCINGIVYKVKDHVLIRFSNRLVPSKLQSMWEDTTEKTKWVTVNRCYFPGDLPEAVGRPCGLESCEVYESVIGCTVMADLIQGPCEVLPPSMFTEEKERRTSLGKKPNDSLPPIYLCRWVYDESKGIFRDVNF